MNNGLAELAALSAMGGFLIGVWFGEMATGSRWRGKAAGPQRMLSAGRFFHVVEDGDVARAREVETLCAPNQENG